MNLFIECLATIIVISIIMAIAVVIESMFGGNAGLYFIGANICIEVTRAANGIRAQR